MRTAGKITHWKADKGYGFITPGSGAKQVFVHISSFSNRNPQPRINELVTFSLSTDKQGRPCAVQVTREGEKPQRLARRDRTRSPIGMVVAVVLGAVVLIGSFAIARNHQTTKKSFAPGRFQCDGRTHCSQMTSCDEATYFIENCPNTRIDGDGDGVPCESQWCG